MINLDWMNIGLFIVIVAVLIYLFFTNKKQPSKKLLIVYVVNIVILCFVLGNYYFHEKHSGINFYFVPIVYTLVILLNLQQIIKAIKSK